MQHNEYSSARIINENEIVEIKLWGLYLLMTPVHLYNEIIQFSLDQGPVEKNPQTPGRITLRFKANEWEQRIKKLLYHNRIPVMVKSATTYSSNQKQRAFAV